MNLKSYLPNLYIDINQIKKDIEGNDENRGA